MLAFVCMRVAPVLRCMRGCGLAVALLLFVDHRFPLEG